MATITVGMAITKPSYYCTEDEFRDETGYTDTIEFTSADILRKMKEATEKLKRDVFVSIRQEFTTADSSDRYFLSRRWTANAYGTNVSHGHVTPLDFRVWEADENSSVSSAYYLQGSRIHRVISQLPNEAISELDSINGFFKLASGYPTESNFRIYCDYWICGKPLREIAYELKMANILWTQILILSEKKKKRLKNGVINLTQGGRSITRSEEEFDQMVRDLHAAYMSYVRWMKPTYNRTVKIGRFGETASTVYPRLSRVNY